ncbi:hypothetical protein [Algoriphagus persicinus]|nr:hypothetical protein [Algoriphagus sp. E1-3-M2]MEB2785605.1 hypothetical protein [Algoriphagus sp. E1-3-M2]
MKSSMTQTSHRGMIIPNARFSLMRDSPDPPRRTGQAIPFPSSRDRL